MGQVFPSYSHHRAGLWDKCKRKWFYQAASRGESFADAAYLLRRLTTPAMLKGIVVENVVRQTLFDFRGKRTVPEPDAIPGIIAAAVTDYRRMIAESPLTIQNRLRKNQEPQYGEAALQCHFYGEEVRPEAVEMGAEGIEKCLTNWFGGNIWRLVQTLPRESLMAVLRPGASGKNFGKWKLNGETVYSPLDFYIREQDKFHVIDWKASVHGFHYGQLGVYGLCAVHHYRQPIEAVTIQAVPLAETGDFAPRSFMGTLAEAMSETIGEHVAKEREKAVERDSPESGKMLWLDIKDFPASTDTARCKACNFLHLCMEGKTRVAVSKADDAPSIVLPMPTEPATTGTGTI